MHGQGNRKHVNTSREDVTKTDIISDLHNYVAYNMNPAHADIDYKHRLRKCIEVFAVGGGKLYYVSGEKCKGNLAWWETEEENNRQHPVLLSQAHLGMQKQNIV